MREAVLVVRERSPTICQRIGKWCSEASRCRAWTERSILFQVMVGITGAFVFYMIVFTAVFLGHVGNYERRLLDLTEREM